MKGFFTAKRLCRAGIIAALYVALTYSFGAIAYNGFLQIRPAEALCILPLFFPEAVPALYIGCMLSNIASPFWVYDVFLGSLATLLAAAGTWAAGKFLRLHAPKIVLGGLFPVLLNAIRHSRHHRLFVRRSDLRNESGHLLDLCRVSRGYRSGLGLCLGRTPLFLCISHADKKRIGFFGSSRPQKQ